MDLNVLNNPGACCFLLFFASWRRGQEVIIIHGMQRQREEGDDIDSKDPLIRREAIIRAGRGNSLE